MTDIPIDPVAFPSIQGRCPACGGQSLFVGSGGWLTCSRLECPEPDAASTLLERKPAPAPEAGLRDQYAEAIEYALLPVMPRRDQRSQAANHAADAVLAVRDTELQQLREMYAAQSLANAGYRLQIDELIRRNREYADRGIANGERAAHLLALLGEAVDWIHEGELRDRIVAALDGREVEGPEKRQLRAQVARVHAYLISLCAEPHPSHDHVCPDDVRRDILAALDQPQEQPPVNSPGSTREQLPAELLALIDMPPYLSTACETAAACETAYEGNRHWPGLLQRAEQLHARCRENHKFTGQPCSCTCHRPTV